MVNWLWRDEKGCARPIQARNFCQAVNYGFFAGPGQICRIVGRAFLDIVRGVVEDEITIGLCVLLEAISWLCEQRAYFGETIPIENKRMQKLRRRQWHQNPATPPPRPILEPALILEFVV